MLSTVGLGTYLRINLTDAGSTQVDANHHNHCNFLLLLLLLHQLYCVGDDIEVVVTANAGRLLTAPLVIWNSVFKINTKQKFTNKNYY